MHKKKIIIIVLLYLFSIDIKFYYNNFEFFNFYNNSLNKKINIGLIAKSIKNGGIERASSLICYYFKKVKIFKLFLFTFKKNEKNEFIIDNKIKRTIITKKNLIKHIKKANIDILLYQLYDYKQIKELNKIMHLKIILINHSCFLHWIYYNNYKSFKTYYRIYKKSDYIISLIPFENDYLFRKWGINSILISNFIPYEYNHIIPSDLSSNIILMIGRANDRIKRFGLGIRSMKYIISEVPQSEMKIISSLKNINYLFELVKKLNLKNFVKFLGYTSNPAIYYKNASIHLFPTLVESFGYVLTETKIYGIPNILVGLDYVAPSYGGTEIIYDDSPLSLAKVAIKILKNERYKIKLGREARRSMKRFNNYLILKRWIKIILSIYKGKKSYQKLKNKDKRMADKDAIKIIQNQINLLKHRKKKFNNINLNNVINFTFMKNLEQIIH